MPQEQITPVEVLRGLKSKKISGLLDVRSEGEFADGAIPFSQNGPILNNEERHLVGTEYKQKGQSAAIELGIALTSPHRTERASGWMEFQRRNQNAALTCWRGGLRSKIAQEWLRDAGGGLPRIEGGYKAVRGELLKVFENLPQLIVLGGWTGSGKTKLLEELTRLPVLDLEKLASHRGSCFGEKLDKSGLIEIQPSQATFENNTAFQMWEEKRTFLIEDESTRIGHLNVPSLLKEKMKISDVVFVEAAEDERAENIYQEYIAVPFANGVAPTVVANFFLDRLKFLKRHLGGLEHDALAIEIRNAFISGTQEYHLKWIKRLLVRHYDKSYEFAFERLKRKVIFRGSPAECREFLVSKS
jgi:tRNA 2-selenouridine synthase